MLHPDDEALEALRAQGPAGNGEGGLKRDGLNPAGEACCGCEAGQLCMGHITFELFAFPSDRARQFHPR